MKKRHRRAEVDEVDDFVETLLRSGPFPGDDADEVLCNAILERINNFKAGIGGDVIDAELLEPELRTAVIIMVHGGRDPHSVPYRHIRHALDNPVSLQVYPHKGGWQVQEHSMAIPIKMRESVSGPTKAIRARCVGCMGGSLDLVRSCSSVNCFLWPFRMGTNPFYGRLMAINDDGDNEDAFEGEAEMAAAEAEFQAEEQERLARMGKTDGNS